MTWRPAYRYLMHYECRDYGHEHALTFERRVLSTDFPEIRYFGQFQIEIMTAKDKAEAVTALRRLADAIEHEVYL